MRVNGGRGGRAGEPELCVCLRCVGSNLQWVGWENWKDVVGIQFSQDVGTD